MEPDGMLNGWNRNVRITSAMMRAWTITRTVSARPPSLRFCSLDTLMGLSSVVAGDLVSLGRRPRNQRRRFHGTVSGDRIETYDQRLIDGPGHALGRRPAVLKMRAPARETAVRRKAL